MTEKQEYQTPTITVYTGTKTDPNATPSPIIPAQFEPPKICDFVELSLFDRLSAIDVSSYIEQKGKLNYLSWANAWKLLNQHCKSANFNVREFDNGKQYYFEEKIGYMVHTSVTVDGQAHSMWLPIMDNYNKAKISNIDSRDISDSIMRCLVKNIALFGLGISLYAGEDIPGAKDKDIKDKEDNKIKSEICTTEQIAELEALKEIKQDAFNKYKDGAYRTKLCKAMDNKLVSIKTWNEVMAYLKDA